MTTSNASKPSRRIRRSVRNTALVAAAVVSLGTVWISTTGSADANRTDAPVEESVRNHSPEFDAAIARYAQARGLSGLSPASLSSTSSGSGCRGLSLASATGCTASELSGHGPSVKSD